jgi:hypothetical protein
MSKVEQQHDSPSSCTIQHPIWIGDRLWLRPSIRSASLFRALCVKEYHGLTEMQLFDHLRHAEKIIYTIGSGGKRLV